MKQKRIYFDNAATTPMDNRVMKAMLPFMQEDFGNASSLHTEGTLAREALEEARRTISVCLGAKPEEICFTSSGTEANNLALKGIAFANRSQGNHIIVSAIEHDCILNTCKWLENQGFLVTYLPVMKNGIINPAMLKESITSKTIMVSVMHANNEIGTIQPLEEIGEITKEKGIYFHSDACQSFGKIPLQVNAMNIDLLTINSHKIYGPKGVAALYIRKGTQIEPLLHGGGHEHGLRSSTENIAGIVGFAEASKLCMEELIDEGTHLTKMRDRIVNNLKENIENIYFNGDSTLRLPGNINFCITGLEGESIRLLLTLDEEGISVSTGSACSSNGDNSSSHVLQAIGLNPFEARGSIRISLGRFNTDEEISSFLEVFENAVRTLHPIFS